VFAGVFQCVGCHVRARSSQSARIRHPYELFFSEYIEGTSNNKALEIYNGTGSAIDLGTAGYNVQMFFNGNTSAGTTINLTGTVSNNDVYVLAPSTADVNILLKTNQFTGVGYSGSLETILWF